MTSRSPTAVAAATAGLLVAVPSVAQADNRVCESLREQRLADQSLYPKLEACMWFYNVPGQSLQIREVKFTVTPLTSSGIGPGKVSFTPKGTDHSQSRTWPTQWAVLPYTTTTWSCIRYTPGLALQSSDPCRRYLDPGSPGAPQHTTVSFEYKRYTTRGTQIDGATSSGFKI